MNNGRFHLIAKSLSTLGGAKFQRLVDAYACAHRPEVIGLMATGSHEAENKTITGTPDSIYACIDGGQIWGEHTTIKEKLVSKFKADLDKCAALINDSQASERPEIILSYNRRLKTKDREKLLAHAKSLSLAVSFLDADELTNNLSLLYPEIARTFLGIVYDTGQALRLEEYLTFSETKTGRFATSLRNPYVVKKEVAQLFEKTLTAKDFLLLSGKPGVGKTRFALELLRSRETQTGAKGFVIIQNHQSIWEDLSIISQGCPNGVTLLIDDANRLTELLDQVLLFIRSPAGENVKLIMTARAVAVDDVVQQLGTLDFQHDEVHSPSAETIMKIISGPPFNISRRDHISRILEVARQNPRFALMMARLANDEPEALTGGLGELFEKYFNRYVKDFEQINTPEYIRTLGILAADKIINITDEEESMLNQQLELAGIDQATFTNCIAELDRREFIARKYGVAVMNDQILRSYYFYRAFIKDQLISFNEWLSLRHHPHGDVVRNVVNSVLEDFGYNIVAPTIVPALTALKRELPKGDLIGFYTKFGQLWPDDFLDFAEEAVFETPAIAEPGFPRLQDKRQFEINYRLYPTLKLIAKGLPDKTNCRRALPLALAYVRKQPVLLKELFEKVSNSILNYRGNPEDRRIILNLYWSHLLQQIESGDELAKRLFLETVFNYLINEKSAADCYRLVEEDNQKYHALLEEGIEIRMKLWETIAKLYPHYTNECYQRLSGYSVYRNQHRGLIAEVDRDGILKLFNQCLQPEKVHDALLIRDFITFFKQKYVLNEAVRTVLRKISTSQLKTYQRLAWRTTAHARRTKNYREGQYEQQKRRQLRYHFLFSELDNAKSLVRFVNDHLTLAAQRNDKIFASLAIIVDLNLKHNYPLGIAMLKEHLGLLEGKSYPLVTPTIALTTESKQIADNFLTLLEQPTCRANIAPWWSEAFQHLTEENIDEKVCRRFKHFLSSNDGGWVTIDTLRKFGKNGVSLKESFRWITENLNVSGDRLTLYDIKQLTETELKDHFLAVKEIYSLSLKQEMFDYDHTLLKKVLTHDTSFFSVFFKAVYGENGRGAATHRDQKLGFIWEYPVAESAIKDCIEAICERVRRGRDIVDNPFTPLFTGLPKDDKLPGIIARQFIVDNLENHQLRDWMIEVCRKGLAVDTEELLNLILPCSPSLYAFQRIDWEQMPMMYSGKINGYKIRKKRWKEITKLLRTYGSEESTKIYLAHAKERVDHFSIQAEKEERRMWIGEYW